MTPDHDMQQHLSKVIDFADKHDLQIISQTISISRTISRFGVDVENEARALRFWKLRMNSLQEHGIPCPGLDGFLNRLLSADGGAIILQRIFELDGRYILHSYMQDGEILGIFMKEIRNR